jgi:bifunctional N-acetylglucosamine-1-phosphate-uridyltransferase/glucosamine-1-phosphate-acetyltransferase GlmU-like protein
MKAALTEDVMRHRVCAVVPAAGRGTRLGAEVPKVFVPIVPNITIWDAIHDKLMPLVDHTVLVLSPDGRAYFEKKRAAFKRDSFAGTEIGLQETPLGMGDAIFGVAPFWSDYENILIVWGDQFNLSPGTLGACLDLHFARKKPALTLPLVRSDNPYVEYVFDASERLTQVRQTREGDRCEPGGFSDIGVFLLSGGRALREEWSRYREKAAPGTSTGEINFLPFLAHLSTVAGWPVSRYETDDPAEAIGINTPEDLAFARQLLQKKSAGL